MYYSTSACFLSHSPVPGGKLEEGPLHPHYRVQTGSGVRCLQFDDNKIVTGHKDGTIKVGSCNDVHVWSR